MGADKAEILDVVTKRVGCEVLARLTIETVRQTKGGYGLDEPFYAEIPHERAPLILSRMGIGIHKNRPKHRRDLPGMIRNAFNDLIERDAYITVGFPIEAINDRSNAFRISFWGSFEEWALIKLKFL